MENTTYRKARGRICVTSEEAEAEGYVKRNKITEDDLKPEKRVGTSIALGRGMGNGNNALAAQSYIIWLHNSSWEGVSICLTHRGGYYVKPTEIFGPGILC